MATRFSHADYTAEQLARTLRTINGVDGFPVKVLAEMAGCSLSHVYTWLTEDAPAIPQGHYLAALTCELAKRGNCRLLLLMMPSTLRLVECEAPAGATVNGSTDDEVVDGTMALAQAAMAERGQNPDALAAQAAELEQIAGRLRGEAGRLRSRLEGA